MKGEFAKPFAVVFAGVPGVGKTPVAHYLSCEFGLPIFSTDQIRYEVREDLRLKDINEPGGVEEFERRAEKRLRRLLASEKSFILDGSMDRRWAERKQTLIEAGYEWFMINIELTKLFLEQLFEETGRSDWANEHLDNYLKQHQEFLDKFKNDISVEIRDESFSKRLEIASMHLKKL